MRQLKIIQGYSFNNIYAMENEGLCLSYKIMRTRPIQIGEPKKVSEIAIIKFQDGFVNEAKSSDGVQETDLLEIVRDRLKCLQRGYCEIDRSKEIECAITHIEEALMWIEKRRVDMGRYR